MTTTGDTVRTAVIVVGIQCRNEAATVAAVIAGSRRWRHPGRWLEFQTPIST
jgi:hypothetical protein